jgi:autotransporter-associated beta strand protein
MATIFSALAVLSACQSIPHVQAQITLTPLHDMVLDANALVLADGGNFSHVINGSPFQQEALITHQGYQYTAWYHHGADQDIYVSRRKLTGTTWETIDTGYDMLRGNINWDSHNVISMGISGDGRIHLSYDHHVHELRYLTTQPGFATSPTSAWNSSGFQTERNALNSNGSRIPKVTYPRFANVGDDLVFTYRDRGSGNGDVRIADYNSQTGLWSSTRFVNQGAVGTGTYDDANNNPSNKRNAYHNGFHADSTGRLHTTWTWREGTQDGNHDINYAYSDDKGATWRNNDGQLVGTNSSPISLNSPGIEVVDLDRRQAFLNQQGQIVDAEGGVHVLAFHRLQGPVYTNSPFSDAANSAYHHYYRDPLTGTWDVRRFPAGEPVGSRPRIGVDSAGNLFGLYTQSSDLVIAGAQKVANGYADWEILYRDQSHNYEGTPLLDTTRLFDEGILSVFLQERPTSSSQTNPTGSPLHVREFTTTLPTSFLTWIGDQSGSWQNSGPSNWNTHGGTLGNSAWTNGREAVFDDNAARFSVNLNGSITPGQVTFHNAANDYELTGAPIAGTGGLHVAGGGRVTLINGFNAYTGDTIVEDGTLELAGGTRIVASPTIRVDAAGTLVPSGVLSLEGQTLDLAGRISGSVSLGNEASVSGTGRVTGNLVASRSVVRVGSTGVATAIAPMTTLIDDFSTGNLSSYIETRILDQGPADNVSFVSEGGTLRSVSTGADGAEQTVLLRSDVGLAVGQELQVDADLVQAGSQDLGIVVAATDAPPELDRSDYVFVALTNAANKVKIRGFDGATPLDLLVDSSPPVKDSLFIARLDENTFELGYYVDSQRTVMETHTLANAEIGSAIGFYSDQRASGTINGLDNLRIFEPNHMAAVGETLTIDGNLTLGSETTLELAIFSPEAADRLVVGGELSAAGVLSVVIDPAAETPQVGDEFLILDFGSVSGEFHELILPSLDSGRYWDTTALLSSGLLSVVDSMPGDFDGDGDVDGADFLAWQRNDGTLAGLTAWQKNYGSLTPPGAMEGASLPVPEANSLLLLLLGVALRASGSVKNRRITANSLSSPAFFAFLSSIASLRVRGN